jgi:branched-chain amino acid aminotransferase
VNTYFNFNGKILRSDKPVIGADNRGFRYGDGVFETLKIKKQNILLEELHFNRLFGAIKLLGMELPPLFNRESLKIHILELCKKNGHLPLARVRLSVFRGNGNLSDLQDPYLLYLIQSWPLSPATQEINQQGFTIDVFPHGRKAIDLFSCLKSNSHLLYVMAALYIKEYQIDDCLVLNCAGRVCDSSIANIFWVKNDQLFTPPLSEGGIAGVMRQHVMEQTRKDMQSPVQILEKQLDLSYLENADEIFLTNAIQGIRWVSRFRQKTYDHRISQYISRKWIHNI